MRGAKEARLPLRPPEPIRESPINKLDEREQGQIRETPGPGSWRADSSLFAILFVEPGPGAEQKAGRVAILRPRARLASHARAGGRAIRRLASLRAMPHADGGAVVDADG